MKRSKFLDQVGEVIRTNYFSYSTDKTYISWIYRFIVYHHKRHPEEMGGKEIKVLKIPLTDFDFAHVRIRKRLPMVLSRDETHRVISNLQGEFHLMASILYGGGLRLKECLQIFCSLIYEFGWCSAIRLFFFIFSDSIDVTVN
jgi:integrase